MRSNSTATNSKSIEAEKAALQEIAVRKAVPKNIAVPRVYHISVPEEVENQRIDNFLITHLKGVPKTYIYRVIRKGEIRVNKGRVKPDYRLKAGDSIRIPPVRQSSGHGHGHGSEQNSEPRLRIPSRVETEIENHILYEDNEILVLNKPAGLAVHGGSGLNFGVIEALRIIRPKQKTLELVHRLDRDTSGCLLIAKKRSALKFLHEQLNEGQVEKKYLALVKGDWQAGEIVDAPLIKNQLSSGERIVRVGKTGKPSTTEFRVLERFNIATLMEIKLITGRTHQIRVHCQYAGHPVAGDQKYGDDEFNRLMKEKGLARLFLHASRVSFILPSDQNDRTGGNEQSDQSERGERNQRQGNQQRNQQGTLASFEAPLDQDLNTVLIKLSNEAIEQ